MAIKGQSGAGIIMHGPDPLGPRGWSVWAIRRVIIFERGFLVDFYFEVLVWLPLQVTHRAPLLR